MNRLDTGALLTARSFISEDFSVEFHACPPCELSLPWRRWHVITFYFGNSVSVARRGDWGDECGVFRRGDIGIYPASTSERIRWNGWTEAMHIHIRPSLLRSLIPADYAVARADLDRHARIRDFNLLRLGEEVFESLRSRDLQSSARACDAANTMTRLLAERYTSSNAERRVPAIGSVAIETLLSGMHGPSAVGQTSANLASAAGLSERQFRHNFRGITGASPHDYLIRSRLELAKKLIFDGSDLAQTAVECGFYDQAYLSRAFTSRIGLPPGEYGTWVERMRTAE